MPDDPVDGLLSILEQRRPDLTSRAGMSRQLAAAGLARAEALLRGLQLLISNDRDDLAGLLIRAIWECWCVGLYVVLYGDDGADHLLAYYRKRSELYAERWPEGIDRPAEFDDDSFWNGAPDPRGLSLEDIARQVEVRLRQMDRRPVRYSGLSSYDVLYRLESTYSAHAGYALFMMYVKESADGTREEIEPHPSRPIVRERAASVAAAYIAHLAGHVYAQFGISTADVDALLVELLRRAGMLTEADPRS
jgi:hypothetical protein